MEEFVCVLNRQNSRKNLDELRYKLLKEKGPDEKVVNPNVNIDFSLLPPACHKRLEATLAKSKLSSWHLEVSYTKA